MSERDTLEAILKGNSIGRFGDGEWRCAIGGGCTSQQPHPHLATELRAALRPSSTPKYIVGIPNPFNGCPREESWIKYTEARFSNLLEERQNYYSSFITRPDNAPWIDTKEYWSRVRDLWRAQNIVLVVGDKKSITSEMIAPECASFKEIWGPRQHAYADIDKLEAEIIGAATGANSENRARILMCLGATATVLAHRLARKNFHAIDMGHIGMFMRHAGAYNKSIGDLVSQGYRGQLEKLHAQRKWGADGAKHAKIVSQLCEKIQPATILDYGCGEMKLAEALKPRRVSGYDPGIPARASMPKPCELVVCTDVLEHIEPTKLDAVMDHIYRLTGKCAYFVISTKLANAILPDGRNAHLIVEDASWWSDKFAKTGWARFETQIINAKEIRVTAYK